jgi:hypothetical protein
MYVLLPIMKCVSYLCLCAYCVKLLSALDLNDTESTEEGEIFEYHEKTRDKLIKASHLNLIHI